MSHQHDGAPFRTEKHRVGIGAVVRVRAEWSEGALVVLTATALEQSYHPLHGGEFSPAGTHARDANQCKCRGERVFV